MTVKAAERTGGADVPGLGSKAVGIQGAAFTGGGYIVNVLGGFGLSILGKDGIRDHAVALAKSSRVYRECAGAERSGVEADHSQYNDKPLYLDDCLFGDWYFDCMRAFSHLAGLTEQLQ